MRRTADRSDLTLQGEPNQHGTYWPRRTIRTNHSPPRLELQEPAQRHMVSRAQRETTKSKHMHPTSPRLLDSPQELGAGSCTFEARQYSAYRFRLPPTLGMQLVQFKLDHRARQRTVLNRHRQASLSPPGLHFLFFLQPIPLFHILKITIHPISRE